MTISAEFIRNELENEKIIRLDLSYLSDIVEAWWTTHSTTESNHLLKLKLSALIYSNLKIEDALYVDKIGTRHISGICATGIFSNDDYRLALIAHESLCELFHLRDIDYPYEDHKALFLKPDGEKYRDWGNGYGEITPHSDDLYEDTSTDILALTVCRDRTLTPTRCYMASDLLRSLNDGDIQALLSARAVFRSGKNVTERKQRERTLLHFDEFLGIQVNLDFRIDTEVGERMIPRDEEGARLIAMMRENLSACNPVFSVPTTGTFFAVANYKVLHARSVMNIAPEVAKSVGDNSSFSDTPRLLYRSKGPRYDLSLRKGYANYL